MAEDQVYINQEVDRLMQIDKTSMERFIAKHKLVLSILEQWFAQVAEEGNLQDLNHLQYFFSHFFTDTVMFIQNEIAAQKRRPS